MAGRGRRRYAGRRCRKRTRGRVGRAAERAAWAAVGGRGGQGEGGVKGAAAGRAQLEGGLWRGQRGSGLGADGRGRGLGRRPRLAAFPGTVAGSAQEAPDSRGLLPARRARDSLPGTPPHGLKGPARPALPLKRQPQRGGVRQSPAPPLRSAARCWRGDLGSHRFFCVLEPRPASCKGCITLSCPSSSPSAPEPPSPDSAWLGSARLAGPPPGTPTQDPGGAPSAWTPPPPEPRVAAPRPSANPTHSSTTMLWSPPFPLIFTAPRPSPKPETPGSAPRGRRPRRLSRTSVCHPCAPIEVLWASRIQDSKGSRQHLLPLPENTVSPPGPAAPAPAPLPLSPGREGDLALTSSGALGARPATLRRTCSAAPWAAPAGSTSCFPPRARAPCQPCRPVSGMGPGGAGGEAAIPTVVGAGPLLFLRPLLSLVPPPARDSGFSYRCWHVPGPGFIPGPPRSQLALPEVLEGTARILPAGSEGRVPRPFQGRGPGNLACGLPLTRQPGERGGPTSLVCALAPAWGGHFLTRPELSSW